MKYLLDETNHMCTSEFYEFTSVEDYLKGCLDETVVSNTNARNLIYGNDCDLVEADTLLDILYISMFTLHDTSSAQSFFKSNTFCCVFLYTFQKSVIFLSNFFKTHCNIASTMLK